jgi:hypothetical protein
MIPLYKPITVSNFVFIDSLFWSTFDSSLPFLENVLSSFSCSIGISIMFSQFIRNEIDSLSKYPTAKLWIQYMDMINIMKMFIKAERTGDWQLYLYSLEKMLPFSLVS